MLYVSCNISKLGRVRAHRGKITQHEHARMKVIQWKNVIDKIRKKVIDFVVSHSKKGKGIEEEFLSFARKVH
jgi:hypothetical protein